MTLQKTAPFLLLILFFSSVVAVAEPPVRETPAPVYMQVSYLSVPTDLLPQVMMIADRHLLPAQKERVKSGAILDWNLYEALIAGPDYAYNFVSITKTTKYGELFGEWESVREHSDLTGLLIPGGDQLDFSLITPLYSEIWVMRGAALGEVEPDSEANGCTYPDCLRVYPPQTGETAGNNYSEGVAVQAHGQNGALPSGNYITKNFMDTRGSSGEHFTLELDFWRPIHHVRIERNILNSWAMYTLSKPGGSSRKYTYSTIDYYDRLSDIEGFDSTELAGIAHPELDETEISAWMNRTGPSRTAWKTELWRRIVGTSVQK